MKTPIFIRHRANRTADLASCKPEWGVEIDLRSDASAPGKIKVTHDPWSAGEDFDSWLTAFCRHQLQGPLVLNTKEDGLEETIFAMMKRHGIENFLLVDTPGPTLVRWSRSPYASHFFARVSHFEPIESIQPFEGKMKWVWVDCFDGQAVDVATVERLKNNFKICLVSPELHGRPEAISQFAPLRDLADAVCTKTPDSWK